MAAARIAYLAATLSDRGTGGLGAHKPAACLQVTRLLQNPLGQPAPDGVEGDIVRVSDGAKTTYLTPRDYMRATEHDLHVLLTAAPGRRRPIQRGNPLPP